MPTYISILRGINVSGQKKIKMTDLKNLYDELGFHNVETYIQSGNIVFNYQKTAATLLEQMIFDKISANYGFEVSNIILSSEEIKNVLTNNPFPDKENTYFTFLSQHPLQEDIDNISKVNYSPEKYQISNKIIYGSFPNGYGKARLNNNFWEKKLNLTATTRNYKTVQKLVDLSTNFS